MNTELARDSAEALPCLEIAVSPDTCVPDPGALLLERVDIAQSTLDLLSVAELLTCLVVFAVNSARASRSVLWRTLPVTATSLGMLCFFYSVSRLLRGAGWGIVACVGLLLGTVFGPHACTVPYGFGRLAMAVKALTKTA